jgi:hypothetical protein
MRPYATWRVVTYDESVGFVPYWDPMRAFGLALAEAGWAALYDSSAHDIETFDRTRAAYAAWRASGAVRPNGYRVLR